MQDWDQVQLLQQIEQEEITVVYLYTPMCGTCQLASRMMEVINEAFPTLEIGKCNLNYAPDFAKHWEIESVPCLMILKNNKLEQKIYAFQSVEYLYQVIKPYTDEKTSH